MLRTLTDNGLAPSLKPLNKEFLELNILNALYELKKSESGINKENLNIKNIGDKRSHLFEYTNIFGESKESENLKVYDKFLETFESIKNICKLFSMDFGQKADKVDKKCEKTFEIPQEIYSNILNPLERVQDKIKNSTENRKPPFVEDESMYRIEDELSKIIDEAEKIDEKKYREVFEKNVIRRRHTLEKLRYGGKYNIFPENKHLTTNLNVESPTFVPNNRWFPSGKLSSQPWYENKLLMTAIKDSYTKDKSSNEYILPNEKWIKNPNASTEHDESKSHESLDAIAGSSEKPSNTIPELLNSEQNYENRSRASSWTTSQKRAYDYQRTGPNRNTQTYGKHIKSRNSFSGYDKNRKNYQNKGYNRQDSDHGSQHSNVSEKSKLEPNVKSFFNRNANFNCKSISTVSTEIIQEEETLPVNENPKGKLTRRNTLDRNFITKAVGKFLEKVEHLTTRFDKPCDQTSSEKNNIVDKSTQTFGDLVTSKKEENESRSSEKCGNSPVPFPANLFRPSTSGQSKDKRSSRDELRIQALKSASNSSSDDDKSALKKSNDSIISVNSDPTFDYETPLSTIIFPKQQSCNYCRCFVKNFKPEKSEHRVYDDFGKVTCPILFKSVCKFCGATGQNAHITNFCPYNGKFK